MSSDIRMRWEPKNLTPLCDIAERMESYVEGRSGVTILENGTLLFVNKGDNDIENARKALNEARHLADFRVLPLNEGDYLVALHKAVAVYVSQKEFEQIRPDILARLEELKFPSEELIMPEGDSENDFLIGLYGRGKLQRDIYSFGFYKRIM